MLVLGRRANESVVADVNGAIVEFHIVRISGDKVRVGITAPPNVPVHRREIYDATMKKGGGKG